MGELRIGSQTPSFSVVLPYEKTKGREAIELYNSTGRTAYEWQELLIYDMLAMNDDNLWTHTKYGYSVPRRNGKSEVVIMRELYGLMQGEQIFHTAHRTSTSHSAWENLCMLLEKAGFKEKEDYKALKQMGLERIDMLKTGGKINFRTRSSKGGLGEGYDLLVIDEAQEYTADQESALKYVVTSSMNPQTIFLGTPPTTYSSGTVFTKYRDEVSYGKVENAAWTEWGVEEETKVNDKEAWYIANPSLGLKFSERSVTDEIGTDDLDFNIQRLGLWVKYNQKSAISENEWNFLECKEPPKLKELPSVGIKFGQDGLNVSMAIACKTEDERIFVEVLDCQNIRNGNKWIIDYLKQLDVNQVAIDGDNGKATLLKALKSHGIKRVIDPSIKEIVDTYFTFEQGIYSQTLCHMEQPSVKRAVTNSEKRIIGKKGGFGYKSQKEDVEIALLESVALAYWACLNAKKKKKRKISY